MTHGVQSTKGHLASNGGLRGHSVGDTFPFIPFMQGTEYCVRHPDGTITKGCVSWHDAECEALHLKEVHNMLN